MDGWCLIAEDTLKLLFQAARFCLGLEHWITNPLLAEGTLQPASVCLPKSFVVVIPGDGSRLKLWQNREYTIGSNDGVRRGEAVVINAIGVIECF